MEMLFYIKLQGLEKSAKIIIQKLSDQHRQTSNPGKEIENGNTCLPWGKPEL